MSTKKSFTKPLCEICRENVMIILSAWHLKQYWINENLEKENKSFQLFRTVKMKMRVELTDLPVLHFTRRLHFMWERFNRPFFCCRFASSPSSPLFTQLLNTRLQQDIQLELILLCAQVKIPCFVILVGEILISELIFSQMCIKISFIPWCQRNFRCERICWHSNYTHSDYFRKLILSLHLWI